MAKSGIRYSASSKGAKSQSSARSAKTSAGSSRRGGRGATSDEDITIVSRDGIDRMKGKTDWARVDALTDEEITRAMASDLDWAP
jgi:hypothetical protein